MEGKIASLEQTLAAGNVDVPEALVQSAIDAREEIQAIKTRIAEKRVRQQNVKALSTYGENDPSYRQLAEEIETDNLTLQRAFDVVRPIVEQQMRAGTLMEQKTLLSQMRSDLEGYRLTEKMLRDRYDSQLKKISESGSHSLDLEFARAELAREEEVFEQIAQRALALRTEMRAPAQVTLMKRADTPSAPLQSLPLKQMALALLLSFGLPFAPAVLWERTARRVMDAKQLKQLDLPFVAEVAALPTEGKMDQRGKAHRANLALNMFEESVDSLRTSLLLAERRNPLQVVLVASAISGEGKTSIASQLAVSMGRASTEPTLLIDADMRSPDIHRIFDLSSEHGLANVLSGSCQVEEAIERGWNENVHILPAGMLQSNPHELFGNGAFEDLLNRVRTRYRRIIIDSPPILSASESLMMAKHADATLLCVMRDHSRLQQLERAHERLEGIGVWPVGAVLSGMPLRRYAYAYGAYAYNSARTGEAASVA